MPHLFHRLYALVCLLCTLAVANFAFAWKIEKFDLPQSRWPGFQDVVIDESGVPWVLANNLVHYFDNDKFVALERSQLSSGQYLTGLYGGPKRGAYLTQPGEKDHLGKIYRLNAGKYEQITTFYYDNAHNRPGIYVSQDGRLFNWGQTFLGAFDDGEWTRVEGHFGSRADLYRPAICDLGDEVYFYSIHDNRIYHCNAASELSVAAGPAMIAEQTEGRKGQSQFPTPPKTSSWNGDRVLVLFQRPNLAVAFNVRTNERIDVQLTPQQEETLTFEDGFETHSGTVWINTRVRGGHGLAIYELSTDGKLTELPALHNAELLNSLRMQYPDSILETSDGAFVIGLREAGIEVYRDGQLTRLNWRHGFFNGVSNIQEGLDGKLWLPYDRSGRGIARLTLGSGPPPTTELTQDWAEYNLVNGSEVWQLSGDTIAMFEVEHPNQLSRRTGDKVSFQEMPFDVTRIGKSIVDDRGHLFVEIYPRRIYEIREGAVDEFENMNAALAAAVKSGATHFQGSDIFGGLFLGNDKRLWYNLRNSNTVSMLKEDIWSTFRFRESVSSMFESPEQGAIIRTQSGKLFRYDTGQMQELPNALTSRRDQMLGPKGVQPYDKSIAADHPRQYYPVLRVQAAMRLYLDVADFERALDAPEPSAADPNSVELPRFFKHIAPSRAYGSWLLMSQGAGAPYRIFDQQLSSLDLSGTPLYGFSISDIVETTNHDVWFVSRYSSHPKAFQFLQSQLSLQAPPIAKQCGRELTVPVEVKPDRIAADIDLFVTVNGELQPLTRTSMGEVVFRFPSSGIYRCSIGGMRLGAAAPDLIEFTVTASVPLPETHWTSAETDVTLTTLQWDPPVRVTPSSDNQNAQLAWRIVGEPWRQFDDSTMISLVDHPPGDYQIELRATEDEHWHDQTPVAVRLYYAPDYQSIVHDLVQHLGSDNFTVRKHALAGLQQLGPRAMPQLKREIEAAEKAIHALPKLRELQRNIERIEQQKARSKPFVVPPR
ncbi:hypothetical protein [Blastopirellula marina]|uniref:Uncharacterized protein n=1 Tax=Blastopirellula marina DSM 3645 TaxID=314230 RepID=A4A172_9BACT|nr:hypothetical protein [Blastopirellula marina]EAQ77532.1 hypothetical protein DSM3645_06714 [Blastopirellula marina DSM 3645]